MPTGELKKVKIVAYSKSDFSDSSKVPDGDFTAMINPESYSLDYKIEYNDKQGQGSSATEQKYKFTKPEELAFEFLFDASGVIPMSPSSAGSRDDIIKELQKFKDLLTGYNGSSHQPNYLKIFWGSLLFKGRLSTLSIHFKLFRPDGRPIRAVAKATFKGSVEENYRVALENAQSADLIQKYMFKEGDSLPNICCKIYGNPGYYLQVAQANGLSHFRDIKPGTNLIFPPVNKMEN